MPNDEIQKIRLADSIGRANTYPDVPDSGFFIPCVHLKSGSISDYDIKKFDAGFIHDLKEGLDTIDNLNDEMTEILGSDGYIEKIEENIVILRDACEVLQQEIEDSKTYNEEVETSSTIDIILKHNTIFNIPNYIATTINLYLNDTSDLSNTSGNSIPLDFISQLNFTGSVSTTVTTDFDVKWLGDDVEDNTFTCQDNKRYTIMFSYDGMFIRGVLFRLLNYCRRINH